MSDKTKPDMLLWVDTETTSINPNYGQLLEVGMILTDMQGNPPTGNYGGHNEWRWIIKHDDIRLTPETAYAITALHTCNGLIDETFTQKSVRDTIAAKQIHALLGELHDRFKLHPAGTNVGFDLDWIHAELLLTLEQLDYHHLDMSSLRMLMQQVALGAWAKQATDHRVMTCLNRDIQEYRHILDKITALAAGMDQSAQGGIDE